MIENYPEKYDVIVCGSGSAGFCAAIQSARAGMKTAVIERYGMSGGIMTVYGNNDVAQFYAHHKQIISGIGWEFILRLNELGYAPIPDMSIKAPHWYYGVRVNIPAAAYMIDTMLIESGVDIFYNQPVVDVESSGGKVDNIIVSTKSGLKRFNAKMYIDCTGDGDICAWAGADFECGDTLQPGTIRYYFRETEIDKNTADKINQSMKEAIEKGELLPSDHMKRPIESLLKNDGNNSNHISGYNFIDSNQKTQADIEGRKSVFRIMESMGEHKQILSNIASGTALRETRRITCDHYITCEDYVSGRDYDDSVCNSFYPIDLHRDGMERIYQIFLEENVVPKIPLSALTVKGFDNLYVAGRCASGDRLANSAYRVKASCMAMGQAAGAAAAVAVKYNNSNSRGCDIESIRTILRENNAII